MQHQPVLFIVSFSILSIKSCLANTSVFVLTVAMHLRAWSSVRKVTNPYLSDQCVHLIEKPRIGRQQDSPLGHRDSGVICPDNYNAVQLAEFGN